MSAEALSPDELILLAELPKVPVGFDEARMMIDLHSLGLAKVADQSTHGNGNYVRTPLGDVLLATIEQQAAAERNRLAAELDEALVDYGVWADSGLTAAVTAIVHRLRTEGTGA